MNPNATPEQSRSTHTQDEVQGRGMDKVADARTDAAARGGGLQARGSQTEREPTDSPSTPKEASIKSSIRLPHERDEDVDMTGALDASGQASPQVQQTARDLAQGLRDTSRAVESDQTYHRLHESEAPPVPPPPRLL